tara:strand:+ start:311 stop:496 length:186 start_codon:yes stop_codon:yes gene_type:complete
MKSKKYLAALYFVLGLVIIFYANFIDLDGFILVIINEGMINIKKHKTSVPIFKAKITPIEI